VKGVLSYQVHNYTELYTIPKTIVTPNKLVELFIYPDYRTWRGMDYMILKHDVD
jgi:hypothetical protein